MGISGNPDIAGIVKTDIIGPMGVVVSSVVSMFGTVGVGFVSVLGLAGEDSTRAEGPVSLLLADFRSKVLLEKKKPLSPVG